MKRIGVDVGGTFTDLVYWDDETGQRLVHKVPSTPGDPAIGTVQGITELCGLAGVEPSSVGLVLHGTTVATNIALERTGSEVGMVTTEGFRDLLHIARKKRPLNFSSYQDLPWQKHPLVRRRHRVVVRERVVGPDGEVIVPLNLEQARAAVRELRDSGVEAVAVCLLFSFLNPAHEQAVRELIAEELPDAFQSVSSEVVPLYREYERFSTTAMNAYVGPKTARYIANLDAAVKAIGIKGGVRIMTSAGGVVTAAGASERPVLLLMSGPAAGLLAGCEVGRSVGEPNVITLDVGGTSSDIGVAHDGQIRMKHLLDTKVAGYDVMIPMIDVETVGAGGGSLASVGDERMLEVGPRSAGAVPGPVCYGRGGTEPTATDAMAVLGWIRPETFFSGRITLDVDAARAAIASRIARPLGLGVEAAALGIHTVLTHNIANAINLGSVRKGHDPREFALVAQGGAGPLFACSVARIVGIRDIVVPPHPGIASAVGLLTTDLRYEFAATVWEFVSSLDRQRLSREYARLGALARDRLSLDGLAPEDIAVEFSADCRYVGQGYELRVLVASADVDHTWVRATVDAFHDIHRRTYSRSFRDAPVQIVNIRAVGIGRVAALSGQEFVPPADSADLKPVKTAPAWFQSPAGLEQVEVRIYDRWQCPASSAITGPAIIEQMDSTILVEPGYRALVHPSGSLLISTAEGGRE